MTEGFGKSGKEKLQQNLAQRGVAICCDQLGVRGGRQDKNILWNEARD